jgi:hypothetical protein
MFVEFCGSQVPISMIDIFDAVFVQTVGTGVPTRLLHIESPYDFGMAGHMVRAE